MITHIRLECFIKYFSRVPENPVNMETVQSSGSEAEHQEDSGEKTGHKVHPIIKG